MAELVAQRPLPRQRGLSETLLRETLPSGLAPSTGDLVAHSDPVHRVRKAELLDGLVHEGPVASGAAQRDATPDKRRQRSIRAEEPLLPILRAEPEPADMGHGRPRRGTLCTYRDRDD